MPSNAMKVSQLIERLQADLATHGDLDCVLCVTELGAAVALDGRNLNVAIELPVGKLPAPAMVFGLWMDEAGRLRSSPGQAYQVAPDGEGAPWSYDREAAPVGTELAVWKRYLGLDRGYRDADGKWFVYEGGAKPVQIIPQGILAWRVP